jgi:germination protein YpeB
MASSRSPDSAKLDSGEAIKKALSFLAEKGYAPMKESYWTRYDNVMLINFAYTEGNVICYPDLVKVEVALDNGDIIGFESTGFIMNHKKRELAAPSVTAAEAKTKVSPRLKILSEGLAVIPTDVKMKFTAMNLSVRTKTEPTYSLCQRRHRGRRKAPHPAGG